MGIEDIGFQIKWNEKLEQKPKIYMGKIYLNINKNKEEIFNCKEN